MEHENSQGGEKRVAKNGPGVKNENNEGCEMDKRRKEAQDKVMRVEIERVKREGSSSIQAIEDAVKLKYATERKDRGVKDTNTAHSGKSIVARVRAALREEGWVEIGDQMVSKGDVGEGTWKLMEAILKAMEGKDRELKLANERISVLTKRVEELEQRKSSHEGTRKVWGQQNSGQQSYAQGGRAGQRGWQKNRQQSYAQVARRGPKSGQEEGKEAEKEQRKAQESNGQLREGGKGSAMKKQASSGEGQGGHPKQIGVVPNPNTHRQGVPDRKDPRIGAPFIVIQLWRNKAKGTRRTRSERSDHSQGPAKQRRQRRTQEKQEKATNRGEGRTEREIAPNPPVEGEVGETNQA